MQSPVLALLRRLEAQNVWRMTYNVWPQQPFSTAAAQLDPIAAAPAAAPAAAASPEWFEDANMSTQDALKLLVERIRQHGPVKQLHLRHLYQRCQSAEDLEKALRLTRLNYLARGELHQHSPFSQGTSLVLLHEAMRLGVPDLAQRALTRAAEFGLAAGAIRHFNKLLVYHSKHADLHQMLEMYELMKRAGPRPDSETCFVLVKGCVDNQRCDLAELVVQEFEASGVRVRNGTRLYLQRAREGSGAPAPEPAEAHVA